MNVCMYVCTSVVVDESHLYLLRISGHTYATGPEWTPVSLVEELEAYSVYELYTLLHIM